MYLIGDYSTTPSASTRIANESINVGKERQEKGMTKARPNVLLGRFIRRHRRALDLSVPDAARTAGVDITFWHKIEKGLYESPSPKVLAPIARVIGAPLADVYGLAGYVTTNDLPEFAPYLRSKYQLPPKALAELEIYFKHLRSHYGIPDDQPVYPPRERENGKPAAKRKERPTGGPWDDPAVSGDSREASS